MGTQLCIFSGYDNVMTVMWFGVVVSFMCKKKKKKKSALVLVVVR